MNGTMLVEFLPSLKNALQKLKFQVYYEFIRIILKLLEHLYKTGFMVKYTDEHCIICTVPPNAQENLMEFWPMRTHEYTLAMLQNQQDAIVTRRLDEISTRIKEMLIHAVLNFVWHYSLVNVHSIIMIDIFHQLLKELVNHLINWLKTLIKNVFKAMCQEKKDSDSTIIISDTTKSAAVLFAHATNNKDSAESGYFNFLKFHVLVHYAQFIYEFGRLDRFDTENYEISHKYLVKKLFSRINKQELYQNQIIKHNICCMNMMLLKNTALDNKILNQEAARAADKLEVKNTCSSEAVPIHDLK
ncbi:uncharacterized protein CIMG_12916 [Coccidioides immitis RS]|uniref:Uncharacterized protein n=1 Tax=Coccidioides immitis (strain RS) TaxID=246410 RepID=J3KG36_COCIM|nr:uncharacterized protein CIMG_12916 [Coccidioides immitis RS]EAS34664.3 hypothetical protein CIMG_12916 [Coccidioides immitis RS]